MKSCSNCFKILPATTEFFYRKLSGLQSRCKACNAEVVRGYLRRKRHPWGQTERRKRKASVPAVYEFTAANKVNVDQDTTDSRH